MPASRPKKTRKQLALIYYLSGMTLPKIQAKIRTPIKTLSKWRDEFDRACVPKQTPIQIIEKRICHLVEKGNMTKFEREELSILCDIYPCFLKNYH